MNDQPRRRPQARQRKTYRRPAPDAVRKPRLRRAAGRRRTRRVREPRAAPRCCARRERRGVFDRRDAALATELVYGTLRRQGTYDAVIAACVDRPLREVDPPVLDVLSLGAHQLLGTRIPTHAAVSATVELAREVVGDGRSRFVNAVLRKIAADDLDGWLAKVAPPYDDDPEEHLAVVHSHPRWVVSALWDALGGGRRGIEDLLEADNERPEVTLVARPGRSTVAELAAAVGEDGIPGRWSRYALRMADGGDPAALEAVRDGRAGVQDEGSQLVALALASAPLEGPDRRWLDALRGPRRQGRAARRARRGARRRAGGLREAAAPGPAGRPHAGRQPRPVPGGRRGRYAARVARRGRSTGCWSTCRAAVSAPCAAARRPAGAAAPRTSTPSARSSANCSAPPCVRSGSAASWATRPAPRTRPRPASWSTTSSTAGPAPPPCPPNSIDARPLLPGVPDLGDGPDIQLWPHLHGTDAMYLALLRRTD